MMIIIKKLILILLLTMIPILLDSSTGVYLKSRLFNQYRKITATVTAYSSSYDECWGDPFITASGDSVGYGVIAVSRDLAYGRGYQIDHNLNRIIYGSDPLLPFGTKIKIEGYNNIFIVKDVLHQKYDGKAKIDLWMPSKQMALKHGIKENLKAVIL